MTVNPETVIRFFPARQVPEINLNESSKNTENALIELPWKDIVITHTLIFLCANRHHPFYFGHS
jgi:hypothetical protein